MRVGVGWNQESFRKGDTKDVVSSTYGLVKLLYFLEKVGNMKMESKESKAQIQMPPEFKNVPIETSPP